GPSGRGCGNCWPRAERPDETSSGGRGGRGARRRGRRPFAQVSRPVWGDGAPAGEQFPGVFEHDDAVTEQAPALLGVAGGGPGRLAVRRARVRTRWRVWAHICASWSSNWKFWGWQTSVLAGAEARRLRL